ncbi:ribosomal protein L1-like protein [Baffinella frigidus]|nr:ribosomal protein L1-like protein [Cryptophyta sp. CCMP2293]
MQALRRTTGTAASLLRCALQPGAVGASRRAAAPLQMHFVRWMVAKLNKSPSHPVDLALTMLRAQDKAKFDESVDVVFTLNVDPRKADQALRGLAVLPHGTGSKLRVAVFATGAEAEAARAAGATYVGSDDLIDEIKNGLLDFDRCVATPQEMPKLKAVARILGPKGLMPNPKLGTVTNDIKGIFDQLKKGAPYRAEKTGLIHAKIGKVSFEDKMIKENLQAMVNAMVAVRPKGTKEPYIRDVFLSTTMGKSVHLDAAEVSRLAGGSDTVVKPKRRVVGMDPADWNTIDLAKVPSKKLRKYLEARRAAAAMTLAAA